MLSNEVFTRQSLELNLFFLRIMKEHAFFLEVAFGSKDQALAQQADTLKMSSDYVTRRDNFAFQGDYQS